MSDPLDQSEVDGYALVMPFVVCQSVGGTYDDDAFAAGWQAGQIDQALTTAVTAHADSVYWPMVHAGLLSQLELIAMHRGYPKMLVDRSDKYPEWVDVTFVRDVPGSRHVEK